ncbi:MAG TPA: folylpolyglutamate synthase/dihydrofolate synthase family protein [Rhizomicrobium sp.]|jgi:dihydrofolate synthase/folylpolyglutamate synthase|nr:folylpolyglutamate synthase/dihydrofolate synthase family protein [Rhizomicrobium sp.]
MSSAAAQSDAILERLLSLHPKRIDLVLDRIERLLAALGHPELKLPPVIHVAGTNGKGSTCAFVRAMLEAQGLKVHVYTSPHLVRFHERIRIAGKLIDEAELTDILEECERANAGAPITFFEITTAAAFLAFSRHPADALVLEVGLGGVLDATNVIPRPRVTIITPVGLDHQEFLGSTLSGIAAEKAGIIKVGVPVIVGPQDDDARDVIQRRAEALNAPALFYGQDYFAHTEQGRMIYQDEGGLLDLPLPKLAGSHQIENAAGAIAAVRAGGWNDEHAIETGLRRVEWPARMQRLSRGPLIDLAPPDAEVWLDGGHNPHAAHAIAAALAELEERSPKPLYFICGMLNTKDAAGFFAPFAGLVRHVTTITIPDEKAAQGAGVLYDAARKAGLEADPAANIEEAMMQVSAYARARKESARILICGSLHLAGKVLAENS